MLSNGGKPPPCRGRRRGNPPIGYTPRKRVAIIEPSEGSPAAEIGLKAGDIIMEINGLHLSNM